MKKLIALMLSILMVCSLAACASKQDSASASTETASTEASGEEKTLTMATNVAFPPYEFYENEQPAGIDVDIATAICEKLGYKLDIMDIEFGAIIIMSTAKLWPKRVDENSCSTITYFLNQASSVGIISLEYQFVSLWLHVLDVTVDYLFCTRLAEVNYRHENHLVENITMLSLYHLVRKFSLDDALVNSTSLLQNLHGIVEVVVALVNIHQNFSLTEQHGFSKCRNLMTGKAACAVLQPEFFQFSQRKVFRFSCTIGCAVQRIVVHQDKFSILGFLQVQFNHVYSHVYAVLKCLK